MKNERTQRVIFGEMVEIFKGLGANYTEYVDFCAKRIEQLDKKKTSTSGTNETTNELKEIVVNIMEQEPNTLFKVSELIKIEPIASYTYIANGEEKSVTSSKLTPILRKLIEEGVVVNIKDKNNSCYKLA